MFWGCFFCFCCLGCLFFTKKRIAKKDIIYHKYDAKNIILVKSSSKDELIKVLAIKHGTNYKNVNFLYDGRIVIDSIMQKEKWGRDGINYKIYYHISECLYAENCGWEDPQYFEDVFISEWNDAWNSAYKQYQLQINSNIKDVKQMAKIIKGPW